MTSPARDRPGKLGALGLIGAGAVEFADYRPRAGTSSVTIAINSNANGTADFYRVSGVAGEVPIAAAVAVVAGTELRQTFTTPLNLVRVRFTAAGAFAVSAEALDDGLC